MKMRRLSQAVLSAMSAAMVATSAYAAPQPVDLSANLGFFYTLTQTEGGSLGENTYVIGSANANSYIWRPWLSTLNLGATASRSASSIDGVEGSKESFLLSSAADFRFLPRSRIPLTLTYYENRNLDATTSTATFNDLVGYGYTTRTFHARQRFIGRGGDQFDLWYNNRMRGAKDIGDLTDQTVGAKVRSRFANHNFYATGTYQAREGGLLDKTSKVRTITAMHNYVPSSQFYIKTLGSHTNYKDETGRTNGSFIANSVSDINQASSFFYWRPVYRPYVMNGAARLHQRRFHNTFTDDINDNAGVNASLSGTYNINRRTQLTASLNGSALETEQTRTISSNQSVLLSYQSDSHLFRKISYRWFGNGGIGNDVSQERLETVDLDTSKTIVIKDNDLSQNFNIGLGQSLDRRWITGNRSTARASITQQVREYFATAEFDSVMTISHTGSMSWSLDQRQGGTYLQMSAIDARSFFDDALETQIVNIQLSQSMPITRFSGFNGSFSMQSTRRDDGDTEKTFFEGFLNVATGRLSYQHGRLFGIYKLKFRTKLDLSATVNRAGGDRKQVDWENRLGYNIGKLSTALVGRLVESDSGLGSKSLIFQINRKF